MGQPYCPEERPRPLFVATRPSRNLGDFSGLDHVLSDVAKFEVEVLGGLLQDLVRLVRGDALALNQNALRLSNQLARGDGAFQIRGSLPSPH